MIRKFKDIPLLLLLTLSPYFVSQELSAQSKEDSGKVQESQEKGAEEDTVYKKVQEEPSFPGGDRAMASFIQEELEYPSKAKRKGLEGVVYVSLVVWKDGKIRNVKVRKGVHGLLDKEAVKTIEAMPDWEPGTQRGRNVPVQVTIPIRFKLNEKEKKD